MLNYFFQVSLLLNIKKQQQNKKNPTPLSSQFVFILRSYGKVAKSLEID